MNSAQMHTMLDIVPMEFFLEYPIDSDIMKMRFRPGLIAGKLIVGGDETPYIAAADEFFERLPKDLQKKIVEESNKNPDGSHMPIMSDVNCPKATG